MSLVEQLVHWVQMKDGHEFGLVLMCSSVHACLIQHVSIASDKQSDAEEVFTFLLFVFCVKLNWGGKYNDNKITQSAAK